MATDPSGWYVPVLLLLLLLHALLTAAEAAARALNLNKLRRQSEAREDQAGRLVLYAEKLTASPSGIRAALTLTSFLFSGVAASAFIDPLARLLQRAVPQASPGILPALSGLIVLLLAAFLFLLLGTVFPRQIASHRAQKTARLLHGLASACHALFLPMAKLITYLSKALVRLSGINPDEEVAQLTEDEIRIMVDVGEERGAIEETERDMIENVFEFNNLTAADCMTHRTDMWAIWIDESTDEIVRTIKDTGLSRFPVYEEDLDHIIGTVSTRDFLLNQQRDDPLPLRDILRAAQYVPESAKTDRIFRDMQHNKYHMAIVVDEYGGTSGLITMEDLLEEIVGNIYDEYDPQVQQDIVAQGEGRFRVAGSAEIEAFNEASGLELPLDEEYDTIGGLLLSLLNAIPDEGSQPEIDAYGLHFRVLAVADRRIAWVEISSQHAKTGEADDV
ncbi:MAG: hemolysin family protein [Christensenellales bacterium]